MFKTKLKNKFRGNAWGFVVRHQKLPQLLNNCTLHTSSARAQSSSWKIARPHGPHSEDLTCSSMSVLFCGCCRYCPVMLCWVMSFVQSLVSLACLVSFSFMFIKSLRENDVEQMLIQRRNKLIFQAIKLGRTDINTGVIVECFLKATVDWKWIFSHYLCILKHIQFYLEQNLLSFDALPCSVETEAQNRTKNFNMDC